jgi:hypothetical protein
MNQISRSWRTWARFVDAFGAFAGAVRGGHAPQDLELVAISRETRPAGSPAIDRGRIVASRVALGRARR